MAERGAGRMAGELASLSSVAEAFRRTAARRPDTLAVRSMDGSTSLTWEELRARVDALAEGLARLGVCHGQPVALMLTNRPEFHLADLAAMMLGAVPFSIYPTASPEQIEYVLRDASPRVALIERAFFEPFMKASQNIPELQHVAVVDGEGEQGTLRLEELEQHGPAAGMDERVEAIGRDDLLTLIYTSGTTGPPKGVELSHGNLIAGVIALDARIPFPEAMRVISWLPSAHIAERAAHHYLPIVLGGSITTCPNPREIAAALPQVKPTFFFAVPRIWEKMKAGLEARLAALPDELRDRAHAAIEAGIEAVRLRQAGEAVADALTTRLAEAEEQLFSKLRAALGLDEAVHVSVGAAPTPREVLEFFHAIGLEIGEVWGMSETCGVGTSNPPGAARIGTVGPPAEGVEIKLAADGEVLLRGACVMKGYRNQPEKTAEVLDADGWLHTGDVGAFDEHGYLRIIDRKKELIINAAGKNMSPANIEATLKSASPLIGQACAIGDARPYNTALIVLDADYAPGWAEARGLSGRTLEELALDETVRTEVEAGVERANQRLSRVEQIKKFHIVPGDWLPGGAELTPTMKLKRRPIAEKYAADIEALYG